MNQKDTHWISLGVFAMGFLSCGTGMADPVEESRARVELGQRLFNDDRFSSRSGDMTASCASCHVEADPQGDRAFTELLSRSWHPWRSEDPERETLRNTPTLLDVGKMPLLHFDGEFSSPEEQAEKTIVGRNFGWLPEERDAALDHVYAIVQKDAAYEKAFQRAYQVALEQLDREETVEWMARAMGDFMRSLTSDFASPYDDFVKRNSLDAGPRDGESAKAYAGRILSQVESLEAKGQLDRPNDFSKSAYAGLKIFFRTSGREQAGNCVACHVPPLFSDFAFHNTGVSQLDYEAVHGSSSFAALVVPSAADAVRPAKALRHRVRKESPEFVDLGYWNFADPKNSPFKRAGESEQAFLTRTVGAFKTPTLRHLASTEPYLHTGMYPTLEEVLMQKIEAAFLSRQGRLRSGDEELASMWVYEDAIDPLFDFLNTLNDRGKRVSTRRPLSSTSGASSYYQGSRAGSSSE